jgi:type IV pilus assembly protein PilM
MCRTEVRVRCFLRILEVMSLFSAPKFLAMPAIGLDISMDAIRFIELGHKGDKLVVSRFAGRQFPMGTVAEGRSGDKKKLQDVIGALAHEFKLGFANVSLPEEQAYLANMQVPRVSPGELHDAIELRLEEYIPIAGADAIFDYVVVGDNGGRRRDVLDVVVSAMPRAIIDEYLEIFHGTGVTPKAFELESQAMARSIIPRGDNGTFLVVDIGKMVTDLFVAAHGVVQFSASLDIGGHNFTQAIAKAQGVTYEEAEALKAKHGLVGGAEEDLRAVLSPVILDFRTRIMQHFMYWQTHHGEKVGGNIEAIYLTGGGANLKGIAEYLAMGVDVQVKIANPWINVCSFEEYVPPLSMRQSHGFSAAIGLALRDSFAA